MSSYLFSVDPGLRTCPWCGNERKWCRAPVEWPNGEHSCALRFGHEGPHNICTAGAPYPRLGIDKELSRIRDAALEEAARVVSGCGLVDDIEAEEMAEAIRALKSKVTP
jgi:hypothetical protein